MVTRASCSSIQKSHKGFMESVKILDLGWKTANDDLRNSAQWSVELEIAIEASILELNKKTDTFWLLNFPFCSIKSGYLRKFWNK